MGCRWWQNFHRWRFPIAPQRHLAAEVYLIIFPIAAEIQHEKEPATSANSSNLESARVGKSACFCLKRRRP